MFCAIGCFIENAYTKLLIIVMNIYYCCHSRKPNASRQLKSIHDEKLEYFCENSPRVKKKHVI